MTAENSTAHVTLSDSLLDRPVQFLRGVGPYFGGLFKRKGIETVGDLLWFLPRRYDRRIRAARIADLTPGVNAEVRGVVVSSAPFRFRGRKGLAAMLRDDSGQITLRWFTAYAGLQDRLASGSPVCASGPVRLYMGRREMAHPELRRVDEAAPASPLDTDAVIPVYSELEGIRPLQLTRILDAALPACAEVPDRLPESIRKARQLPPLGTALAVLHRPPETASLEALNAQATPWHRRLIYEELFVLQLAVLRRRHQETAARGRPVRLDRTLAEQAQELFPFALTGAQSRVLTEIEADLGRGRPMHRLLQGDVGSGKTAVAVAAAWAVARAGHQVAVMAPTEILAEQLARVFGQALSGHGVQSALLTGSTGAAERRDILKRLDAGDVSILLGTHAVIQQGVRFSRLALGIVDEQHRFGVRQRARLAEMGQDSAGQLPHLLVMTATPIPRTLALTAYGDLDVSLLDELPPGRQPVRTRLYRRKQSDQVYEFVRQEVSRGRQAYVVFPLIEESDKEGMERLQAATTAMDELQKGALANLRVALLHGRLTSTEKEATMQRFRDGLVDVLICTTVIEVGIDVANATTMVVENAERFGLSQLHQLRGRVGRGAHQSACLLIADYTPSEDTWRRLLVMTRHHDGFRIAEEDLAIRGPGDVLGTRQSGAPWFAMADLTRDGDLLDQARADALEVLAVDPSLGMPEHRDLAQWVEKVWTDRMQLAQVG